MLSYLRFVGTFFLMMLTAAGQALAASPADQINRPAKVYSSTDYHVIQKGRIYGQTERTITSVCIGCGILVDDGHGPLLVTAAHVVAGEPAPAQIAVTKDGKVVETLTLGKRAWVTSADFTVRVSNLSLRPVSVFCDRDKDLAVLKLSDYDLKLIAVPTFSAPGQARVGQRVIAWGFHDSPDAQLEEARVSDIDPDFFTLNRPVDSGFSGGPVVDEAGSLLGMIDRSTDKQTRCIPADSVWIFIRQYRDRLVPVSDHMNLSGQSNGKVSATQPGGN